MKKNRYQNWIQKVIRTQEDEISCSECFHWVSHYVDVELTGGNAQTEMPQVKHHLEQCAACREEYETLRDISQLDKDDEGPSIDDLMDSIH